MRSFSIRINDINKKGGKRNLTPIEVFSQMDDITHALKALQSVPDVFVWFLEEMLTQQKKKNKATVCLTENTCCKNCKILQLFQF